MKPVVCIVIVLCIFSGCAGSSQIDLRGACVVEQELHTVLSGLCGVVTQPNVKYLNMRYQQMDSVKLHQADSLLTLLNEKMGK